ncbi:type II toxin-antitoxin system Phd/YefM family antitoxin [Rhizobium sp. S-51]|uniref:Antitoxin n=1 Tax=Rhizobium terricola TaxID=2728849 RepID=A0A7Y0AW49_9HYPH|nr:type II toxin-antitoxin system Phd/YefM family antitoxin [Rhizobium terricola]NML74559.1 type II toxin-antitoxin system Phd/YefM family antitoxin [Rhizobium terricola]
MRQINIHEAKTHLSRLVDEAASGEPFIIAKAGRPVAKVVPVDAEPTRERLGFMKGFVKVPEDFDRFGETEIADMFGIDG